MLAIVVPARDEGLSVGAVVSTFREVARTCGLDCEVLVVDDASVDDTSRRAMEAGACVIRPRAGSGLANAFRAGVTAALRLRPDAVLSVDADGQYTASDLEPLAQALRGGADLVLGNRLWCRPEGMTPTRYRSNLALSRLVSRLAGVTCTDTQTGLRMFTPEVARAFEIRASFTYTQEQIIRAARGGAKIVEADIAFAPRLFGKSRLVTSAWSYGLRVASDLVSVQFEQRGQTARFAGHLTGSAEHCLGSEVLGESTASN